MRTVRARGGEEEPAREMLQLCFDLGVGYIGRTYIKIHSSESWLGWRQLVILALEQLRQKDCFKLRSAWGTYECQATLGSAE